MFPFRVFGHAIASLLLRGTWILLVLAAPVVRGATSRPDLFWISASENAPADSKTYLGKSFASQPSLLRAVILTSSASDGEVLLNGRNIGAFSASSVSNAVSFDITRDLISGSNFVVLATHSSTQHVAALVEMVYDLGALAWVGTDKSWHQYAFQSDALGLGAKPFLKGEVMDRGVVVDLETQISPFSPKRSINAYDSWKLALKTNQATAVDQIQIPPGFEIELLRSALPDEGSWVGMAFDPAGRLTLAREKRGLIRCEFNGGGVSKVEEIENSLLECRGLLYAYDSLYVNANNSRQFVRLRENLATGKMDRGEVLLTTEGGVGHGRNHVVLGPDGMIYLVHGNNVTLTPKAKPASPLEHFSRDRMIPCPWDDVLFDGDVTLPAGHILRTDRDGKEFELVAGGFRNPLDIDFNREGDFFTFDADMEWDVGLPWYRPNRINLVVSGGEYGWRRGTSKWPDTFPDVVPSVLDIGLASPTAVGFGYASDFPVRLREAFFVCDWAYGRIIAVHLRPQGAGYIAESEKFVSGRPLNVTDFAFGPDRAMYFITGGRGTQSGLYRLKWKGSESSEFARPWTFSNGSLEAETSAPERRQLRRHLESFHRRVDDKEAALKIVEEVWPLLGHSDPAIQYAARIALEHQPTELWSSRALEDRSEYQTLSMAWLALSRLGQEAHWSALTTRLENAFSRWDSLSGRTRVVLLRACGIMLSRWPESGANHSDRERLRKVLEPKFPGVDRTQNRFLCEMLVHLRSPKVLSVGLERLAQAADSEELVYYLFFLRTVEEGWTLTQRKDWFRGLERASHFQGANDYQPTLRRMREEMLAKAPESERAELLTLLQFASSAPVAKSSFARAKVKDWVLADFAEVFQKIPVTANPAHGKEIFLEAQCATCHRKGSAFQHGAVGPDLTGVGGRFGPRELLESILEPSKVVDEKYRRHDFESKDHSEVSGMIVLEDAQRIIVRPSTVVSDPDAEVTLLKANLLERRVSSISPMPEGLLSPFQRQEILDLIAFLQSEVR